MSKTQPAADLMAPWVALAEAGAQAPMQCVHTLARIAAWQAQWLAGAASLAFPAAAALAVPADRASGLSDLAAAELALLENGPGVEAHIID